MEDQAEYKTEKQMRTTGRQKQARTNRSLKARIGGGGEFKDRKHVDILSFNSGAERRFIELVRKMIEETDKKSGGAVSIAEVLREAAYELDVSTTTVKRYLTKHSARRAEFRVFGEYVILNPNYEEPDYLETESV